MQTVAICKEFGWTYEEYMNQPLPFIQRIKEMMSIDSQNAAKANKGTK
jgi:hypothetical protein